MYLGGLFSHAFPQGPNLRAAPNKHTTARSSTKKFLLRIRNPSGTSASATKCWHFLHNDFADQPLYARIDMVTNESGVPEIMEIELTEPSLYLHLDAEAPTSCSFRAC